VDIVVQPHSVLRRDDTVLAPVAFQVARKLAAEEGATTPVAIAEMLGVQTGHVRRLLALDTRVLVYPLSYGAPDGVPAQRLAGAAGGKVAIYRPTRWEPRGKRRRPSGHDCGLTSRRESAHAPATDRRDAGFTSR
jgi:hypothetical protein